MTKKTVKATPAPKKRKLLPTHRAKLLTLAATKFVAHKERAAEQKFRDKILAIFLDFHANEIAPALDTMRKFGMTKLIAELSMPLNLNIKTGVKKIEAPGGKLIERDVTECIYIPTKYRGERVFFAHQVKMIARGEETHAQDYNNRIKLPETLEVPAGLYSNSDGYFTINHDDRKRDGDRNTVRWLPAKLYETLDRLFIAGKKRMEVERSLLRTIAILLEGANYYEDLLEVWPEAAEIEHELFESVEKPVFALVTLSDDDKALLCSNMKSRGVKSLACAA